MTSFDTYDKDTLDTKFAGKLGSFAAVGGQTPTVENGSADLTLLFSHKDTYEDPTISNLLNNSELEKSIKICAEEYGGTQIKKDDEGNYYYEVETED